MKKKNIKKQDIECRYTTSQRNLNDIYWNRGWIEVKRDNYNTMLGTFNASKWRYNNTQRGKTTRQVSAILKETLSTDWLTEPQANLMEKLIMSTDVYIVENAETDYTEGVIVTDSSFVRKTGANDKLIKYTINIEYANPINTNS